MAFSRKITPLIFFILLGLPACSQQEKKNVNALMYINRLAQANSPYLQQHADNPVDWYEWGPEALEKAQKENKPLLISIGYAACHWCHVMEHESFMDSTVAQLMNEKFVCIKIDREERPDIDQIYMNAAMLISGRGGWPLNAFATPKGEPFYAATYFPKDQWVDVLQQLSDIYENEPEKIEKQARSLTEGIQRYDILKLSDQSLGPVQKETYVGIYEYWEGLIDFQKGGFRRAPKFPLPVGWAFLLQYHYLTGNPEALQAVEKTLEEMARGGIYDQIGGGFARYSTDDRWFAPHFEKMLYDNGQLVSLYAQAYQVTNNPLYEAVIRETLAFVEREMSHPEGGFYASLNADSEGEEGKFYVWKASEFEAVLGNEKEALAREYFQVKKGGNWERDKNILIRKESPEAFAQKKGLNPDEWKNELGEIKKKLRAARAKKIRPSLDDKILTSWNALMLRGYVQAYRALGNSAYLERALQNARFLEENMLREGGRLWRNFKGGSASIDAFLDDYALLARAWIELYQVTLDIHWLEKAKEIADYVIAHFRDEKTGLFFYTSDASETLIARKMEVDDNVIPASNSVLAQVLYRLGTYYQKDLYLEMSQEMLQRVLKDTPKDGPYKANWAQLMGLMAYGPYEIAVMGKEAAEKNRALQKAYLPTAFFMGGEKENLPLLENKLYKKKTRIYVCRERVCKLPVEKVEKALEQIKP